MRHLPQKNNYFNDARGTPKHIFKITICGHNKNKKFNLPKFGETRYSYLGTLLPSHYSYLGIPVPVHYTLT